MGGRGAIGTKGGSSPLTKGEPFKAYYSRAMDKEATLLVAKYNSQTGNVYLRKPDEEEGEIDSNGTATIHNGLYKGRSINLDLSKAKTVSGKTFDYSHVIKQAGLTWNGEFKVFVNKSLLTKEESRKYFPNQ